LRLKFPISESRRAARRLQREVARQLAYERGETSVICSPSEGLSTARIVRATIDKIRELSPQFCGDYLDVGSGNGKLIDRVIREFRVTARACDYRSDLMTIGDLAVDAVDLNAGVLPYEDASFDLVTCTEVIEHLEHYRPLVREMSRILRLGGVLIISTPNVLNLRSRLRYLLFGFFNMFGPIRLEEERHHSTHGHINPVSYFYLAHALSEAGFAEISFSVDKRQRRSWLSLLVLWLPIRAFSAFCINRERNRRRTVDAGNERFVREMNRSEMLLGRTLIVGCRKPQG
jgi:2-polyprenyl-3-methyl-5-hydroxy-6-metoxy-1,4-benzoquinol methylase